MEGSMHATPTKETTMKFLLTYAADPKAPPPTPEKMMEIGKLTAEMVSSGVVIMTGGLVRPSKGTQLRCAAGKGSVTDGPFAETKEITDGFAQRRVEGGGDPARHPLHEHRRRWIGGDPAGLRSDRDPRLTPACPRPTNDALIPGRGARGRARRDRRGVEDRVGPV